MGGYGSKDSKYRRTSKLNDWFKSYVNFNDVWIWNQSTVDDGGVSRGRSVTVGVSDRWKVTCDMRQVEGDM